MEQVGKDRLVSSFHAAKNLNDQHGVIIVDAGTALTIDYIDENSIFCGGIITPGARAMFASLAAATDALPDLSPMEIPTDEFEKSPLGNDTRSAILKGVYHSQIAVIKSMVDQLNPQSRVILTGGGIQRLRPFLPQHWEYDPTLVLKGALDIGKSLLN